MNVWVTTGEYELGLFTDKCPSPQCNTPDPYLVNGGDCQTIIDNSLTETSIINVAAKDHLVPVKYIG